MKKPITTMFICLCLCIMNLQLTGCSGHTEEEITEVVVSGETTTAPKIGLLLDSLVIERWERDRDIFISSATELGAQVEVQNANSDVAKQKELFRRMIEENLDCIVVVPVDSGSLQEEVKLAHEKNIPVIAYDRIIQNAGVDLYISFDNEKVGQYMAECLNDAFPSGASYLKVNGPVEDNNVSLVNKGFDETIHSNFTKIDETNCPGWADDKAFEYMNTHPEYMNQVNCIMCGNDSLASQVIRALSERRKAGQILVTGQDADLTACQRIIDHTQLMTVYKPIDKLASLAAHSAYLLATDSQIEEAALFYDGRTQVKYQMVDPIKVTESNLQSVIIDSGFHTKDDIYRTY